MAVDHHPGAENEQAVAVLIDAAAALLGQRVDIPKTFIMGLFARAVPEDFLRYQAREVAVVAERAWSLLASARTKQAFDLAREPAAVRDRYGRGKWSQSVLLARRLIEAGVRMVFVNWPREPGDLSSSNPLWDTHGQNDARMKNVLCPQFDTGFTALIDDLADRGLLDETLVVAIGEMGRTPKFNASGGRDHWGNVFSFVMAGAAFEPAETEAVEYDDHGTGGTFYKRVADPGRLANHFKREVAGDVGTTGGRCGGWHESLVPLRIT